MYGFLLCVVLLTAVPPIKGATVYNIQWTAESLANFSTASPLMVNIKDVVAFTCSSQTDIWIVNHVEQYEQCSCNAALYSCENDARHQFNPCVGSVFVNIAQREDNIQRGEMGFVIGTTYYFTEFTRFMTSGNCNQTGLRMAMQVVSIPTTSSPTTLSPITLPVTTISQPDGVATTSDTPQEISPTSEIIEDTTYFPDTDEVGFGSGSNETTVAVEGVRDNSVAIITSVVVAVVALVSLPVVAVILLLGFILFKKRKEGLSGEETIYYTDDGQHITLRTGQNHQTNNRAEASYDSINENPVVRNSLQTYEPMTDMIRTSQSDLIKGTDGENNFKRNPEDSFDPNTTPNDAYNQPDLINLQSPTHSLQAQSSVTSFTHLANKRASKKLAVSSKQQQDVQPGIVLGKSFLPKSQSVEFLDRIGPENYHHNQQPMVTTKRKKHSNASTEDLTNPGPSNRPAKTRTLPRPKLSRDESIPPLRYKEFKREKITDLGFEEAKKRLSCFEKSGEVFSLTESL